MDFPDDLKKKIAEELGKKGISVVGLEVDIQGEKTDNYNDLLAHWGVTEEQYGEWCDDMLCTLIKTKSLVDVLAKYFSELDAETRVKIVAFSEAKERGLRILKPQ